MLKIWSTAAAVFVAAALTVAATALAGPSAGQAVTTVTILDGGKVKLARSSIAAGSVTFVAVNKGKQTHALAIMGPGISGKRTAALAPGKTARLTVKLRKGMYMLWDPIRGSMNRSAMLMVASAAMGDMKSASEPSPTITVGTAPDAPPTMNPGDDDPCMGGMHC